MCARAILVRGTLACHKGVAVSLQLGQGEIIFVFIVNQMRVDHSAVHVLHGKDRALTKIVMVMPGKFESLGYACPT